MKRILPIVILTIIAFFFAKPFFQEGYFSTHDGEWAIVRLAEMQREIKDLQIPPRWADYLNHGFGYPLFSFTYPFPYYVGTIFRFFHVGLVDSVKIIFVLSIFLSGLFMFVLGREIVGDWGGFISAIFYMIAPYRLVNLYVRGSIGESLGFALFPLLLLLSLRYILKPTPLRLALASLSLGLFILNHNITALIFFPFWLIFLYVIVFAYYEDVKRYTIRYFPPLIILGLGLSAYFFIPALLEKKYIILSQIKLADISSNFIKLPEYFISPWNYGIKPSYQLGWAHILGALVGLVSIFISNKLYKKKYMPFAMFTIVGIGIPLFLAHSSSGFFWRFNPLAWIDFPWRFMMILTFFLAFSTMFLAIHKITKIIAIVLIVIVIVLSLKFANPADHFNKGDDYYATNDATTTSMDELMPVWVLDKPKNRYQSKVSAENRIVTVSNVNYNSHLIEFDVSSLTDTTVKVNTIYFPGWQFFVDRKKAVINYAQPDGLINVAIPSGNHKIVGKFTETQVRFISNMITLASLGMIFGLVGYSIIDKLMVKKA